MCFLGVYGLNDCFSGSLSRLRKERKLSQKQVAAELGVSQALLSHYENGIRECGLDFLVKAARFYEVSSDYMLGISPDRQPDKQENAAVLAAAQQVAAAHPDFEQAVKALLKALAERTMDN